MSTRFQQDNIIQKSLQMEKFLQSMGISPDEIKRAVSAYFEYPTPQANPWPGGITGIDNAGNQPIYKVPDTGFPPKPFPIDHSQTEPYPTSSNNPYPNNPTPDGNSIGNKSNTYEFHNSPAIPSKNWLHDANKPDMNQSMHGLEGYVSELRIPPWRYPVEDSQMYDLKIPDIVIPPSYNAPQFREVSKDFLDTKKQKKSLLSKLSPWLALLGGIAAASSIIDSYQRDSQQIALMPDFTDTKDIPAETKLEKYYSENPLKLLARYILNPLHKGKDICDEYAGKTFDLLDTSNRPVLSSENMGYTTTHPNCSCTWEVIVTAESPDSLTRKQQSQSDNIKGHITKAATNHTLHTVRQDGSISSRTRGTSPLRETIGRIREEFNWLEDDYLSAVKKAVEKDGGQLYLVRAASETITDHRAEGDLYRRKLTGSELQGMARTATGKRMDINHNPDYTTDAIILDSEYDGVKKEIQMIIIEKDPEIITAIKNNKISAVSINGGVPRSQSIELCDDMCNGNNCELCNVPKGTILAELDGIGLTWVVTAPEGIYWKGEHIVGAKPGIQSTKIEIF